VTKEEEPPPVRIPGPLKLNNIGVGDKEDFKEATSTLCRAMRTDKIMKPPQGGVVWDVNGVEALKVAFSPTKVTPKRIKSMSFHASSVIVVVLVTTLTTRGVVCSRMDGKHMLKFVQDFKKTLPNAKDEDKLVVLL
jgi:hypothetical protein